MESLSTFEVYVGHYWNSVEALIQVSGALSQAVKLEGNLRDPTTEHRVHDVLEQYYGGSIQNLEKAIASRHQECLSDIAAINTWALRLNLSPVKKPEILINLLFERDRRERWKRIVCQCKKKSQAMSLQDVEREYHRRVQRQQMKQNRRKGPNSDHLPGLT